MLSVTPEGGSGEKDSEGREGQKKEGGKIMSKYQSGFEDALRGAGRRDTSMDYMAGYIAGQDQLSEIDAELQKAESKRYQDEEGHEIFVSDALSDGKYYGTFKRKPGRPGTHRIVSKVLPLRQSAVKAQRDLDVYALLRGWERIGVFIIIIAAAAWLLSGCTPY